MLLCGYHLHAERIGSTLSNTVAWETQTDGGMAILEVDK